MSLLMSGIVGVGTTAVLITVLAHILAPMLHRVVGQWLTTIWEVSWGAKAQYTALENGKESEESMERNMDGEEAHISDSGSFTDSSSDSSNESHDYEYSAGPRGRWFTNPRLRRLYLFVPPITLGVLLLVRPKSSPYGHLSGTLPFSLMAIFGPPRSEYCSATASLEGIPFPLPHLISKQYWEEPRGYYRGWFPVVESSHEQAEAGEQNSGSGPSGTPTAVSSFRGQHGNETNDERVRNARRFADDDNAVRPTEYFSPMMSSYDSAIDPLRISNLGNDILAPLRQAIEENNIKIRHVVLISLESTRKDVFPLKKGSDLYNTILKSHGPTPDVEAINSLLGSLTPVAEFLTGEAGGFDTNVQHLSEGGSGDWRTQKTSEYGGINVVGALTGSTATCKSLLVGHCGVEPLPVDYTEEVEGQIYQLCLPQILDLFNEKKANLSEDARETKARFQTRPWGSAFVSAVTDQFDRQDELDKHMGFSNVIVRATLSNSSSKFFPPTEPESNYFGYPEKQVKPYIRDLIIQAEEKNERLFLSHLTSSTHHPWSTPKSFGEQKNYMGSASWINHQHLNKYLNTVAYADAWLGEILDELEDTGVANETLVVMVGDQ
jgi:Sulfatase